jgi:hypothetical protein
MEKKFMKTHIAGEFWVKRRRENVLRSHGYSCTVVRGKNFHSTAHLFDQRSTNENCGEWGVEAHYVNIGLKTIDLPPIPVSAHRHVEYRATHLIGARIEYSLGEKNKTGTCP